MRMSLDPFESTLVAVTDVNGIEVWDVKSVHGRRRHLIA